MATRVLIAGGGVAALEAALALREGRVSVEMLAPSLNFGTGRSPSPSRSTSAR